MTTLETRIYTHPAIPLIDITPLEHLILTHALECSETEEGLVLFTDLGSVNPVPVSRGALIAAWRASVDYAEDPFSIFIASRVIALLPASDAQTDADALIDIDLAPFPWQFVVQGIVVRSKLLDEVKVIQWMNHPSQRPESYGASVSLITARAIHHATSEDLLVRFREQDRVLPAGQPPADTKGPAISAVREIETVLCLWEAMLYFRGQHQAGCDVPASIVSMSEFWDKAGWQAMRLNALDLVSFALDVYGSLSEDLEEEGFTFDFDFAPAFVESLLWSEDGAYREGEPEEFLEEVMAKVRHRRKSIIAQNPVTSDRSSGNAAS